MQHLTFQQIEALAYAGANLTLDSSRYRASDLQRLAIIVKNKGGKLTLQQTNSLSAQQMLSIAFAGGNNIFFES